MLESRIAHFVEGSLSDPIVSKYGKLLDNNLTFIEGTEKNIAAGVQWWTCTRLQSGASTKKEEILWMKK